MPLPGGLSDKYGNRFEGKWTARCLTELLSEEVSAIRLEPPGDEGVGCEFWLMRKGVKEYHQVKRQHSTLNGWTIPELGRRGVLRAAYEKTSDPESRYIFVSSVSSVGLDELIDPTRQHVPFDEFKREFLNGSRKRAWNELMREWRPLAEAVIGGGNSQENITNRYEEMVYERLSRIQVRVVDEVSLGEHVATKCSMLSTKNPKEMMNDIIAYALDNLMVELRADTMWEYLSALGHRRTHIKKDSAVIEAIRVQNQRYQALMEPMALTSWLDRGEVDEAFQCIEGADSKQAVLLSGQAGIGKSVALGQVLCRIREKGYPHLYFRIDRLEPEQLPERIGRQLNLPGSPVEVLAAIADGRTCVLVVDQLDAVSMVSGRNPEFFECIHEIIRKVIVFPNMRLVLACRQYDLENDNRLRELVGANGIAKEIQIGLLTAETVRKIMDAAGFDGKNIPASQVEMLRLPLHLGMYLQVMDGSNKHAWQFSRTIDLFAAYWGKKRTAVSERIKPKEAKWESALDCLIDRLTSRQTLFAPAVVLDEYADTAKAMVSEGVLVEDSGRVGFFHEAFFDYCFARCFLRRGGDIRTFLKSGEQHLFKRAPLRQVLLHMRDSDEAEYITQLELILGDSSIRFHIKKAALEALTRACAPTDDMWRFLNRLMMSGNSAIMREVQNILLTNNKWFKYLNSIGIMEKWLNDERGLNRELGQRMVASSLCLYPHEAVALLRPYVGVSSEWTRVIIHALWFGDQVCHREAFELLKELIVKGQFECAEDPHAFWMCLHSLSDRQPEWAAEAIGLHLRRQMTQVDMNNLSSHIFTHDQSGERHIDKVAERAPSAFLDHVLPLLLQLVVQSAYEREGRLQQDPIWGARAFKNEASSMEEMILDGCEKSLRALASTSLSAFMKWIERLWSYGDYDTINYLLVRGFSEGVEGGADRAVEYLIENPQRMECGWGISGGGEASYWAGRECIANISRLCSSAHLSHLCSLMVEYFPKWECTAHGFRERGHWQMVMLSAIEPSLRTEAVKARIGEWQRKFPHWKLEAPKPLSADWIGSPIPDTSAKQMPDKQWLNAMRVHNTEDGRRSGSRIKGGVYQLSSILEKAVQREPKRFASLACQFDERIHGAYFDAVLRGLKEACAGGDIIYPVVRHFFSLSGKPGSRWMCGPITKLKQEVIPDDIMSIMGWLATKSSDPESDKLIVRTGREDDRPSPHDLVNSAINCTRGSAAEAIEELLMEDQSRVALFLPYIEHMVNDPSVIVRTTVAGAVLGVFKWEEGRAIDLFVQLCDTPCDELLATSEASRFIAYAVHRHIGQMKPILERMIYSGSDVVRETGARLVALAQFFHDAVKPLLDICLHGDESLRLGVARVAEANLFNEDCREFCHSVLAELFSDPSKKVRDKAADAFRRAEGRDLESCIMLIREFSESAAFEENIEDLTWAMRNSTADIDEEILIIGDAVFCALETENIDRRGRLYLEGEHIAELIVRAYRKSKSAEYQSRCLDRIDRLLSVEASGILKELEAFER